MREHLLKLLPDRTLPGTSPLEDYFEAGPVPAAARAVDSGKQAAVLANIRRQRRRSRHSVAA